MLFRSGELLAATAESSGEALAPLRFPGEWSGGRFLWFTPQALGAHFTVKVPVATDDRYQVLLWLVKASDFGLFQLSIDGQPQGPVFDGYNGQGGIGPTHVIRAEAVDFGEVGLEAGTHDFRFDVTGRAPEATS